MKIAIVGSGVAGLTSAYLLAPHHEVTIIEKSDRIGGHAHTIQVKEGAKTIPVDNGFMVFNPKRYPTFVKLLRELDVKSMHTNMTFGVSIPGVVAYRGNFPNGIFAKRSTIFNMRYLKFLLAIVRFRKLARQALANGQDPNETLADFLSRHSINKDIADWFLYPMLSAIWSMQDVKNVGDFPALSTFRFLDNHRLLSNRQPTWHTIAGGSIAYVSKVEAFIRNHGGMVKLSSTITNVSRSLDTVTVTVNGKQEAYDYIIFATHADITKQLLTDITDDEKDALAAFSYSTNTTVLHKDTSLVPRNKRLLAAWNYTHVSDAAAGAKKAVFTYCMNILQHIPKSTPVFVTLNAHVPIDEKSIYHREIYEHPRYTVRSLAGQRAIANLQGERRTIYAGAYLGYGFHEDGVVSGVQAAKILGITPPWQT